VSKGTIDSIVRYSLENKMLGYGIPDTPEELGDVLWKENFRSVNFRYQERNKIPKYTYNPGKDLSYVEFIKLLKCLDYQSCERKDYEKSKAFMYIRVLCWRANRYELPGYEEAPWGLDG